jgi:NTP pyrophosphatase (non-canonical NTP hydrolase)
MEIAELMEKSVRIIEGIDKYRKAKHDVDLTILHLMEELGEASKEIYNFKTGREEASEENLKRAIFDSLVLNLHLIHLLDFDVEKLISSELEYLKEKYDLEV